MSGKQTKSLLMSLRRTAAVSAMVCMLVVTSHNAAYAVCETPGAASSFASSVFKPGQQAAVAAAENAIKLAIEAERMAANAAIGAVINTGRTTIFNRLNKFWQEWLKAMQDQTKQLNSGQIDQTRQMVTNFDANNMQEAGRQLQQSEFDQKKQFAVSDEACRFDTTAKYLGRTQQMGKAVATGFSSSFNNTGNNKVGTPGEFGKKSLHKARWDSYMNRFCDPNQNGGGLPCSAPATHANAHILPSKTIFAKETIDLSDPVVMDSVNQLVYNVSGYDIPDPIAPEVQESAIGREARQNNRENMTQMDAVSSLIWSVVGERAVGQPAAEVKQLRVRAGVSDASDKPSEREIRQKILEEIWDPRYYIQLNDGASTVAQKEIYLKAYSLVLLYQMIEKTEKISGAYAIQAANMLDKFDTSRHAAKAGAAAK